MKRTVIMSLALGATLVLNVEGAIAQGIGFKGIGLRAGLVSAERHSQSLVLGAHLHLGEIAKNLVVFPSVDYWREDAAWQWLSINGTVQYTLPVSEPLDFFAGGGPAFNKINKAGVYTPALDGEDGTETTVSLNLLAGLELRLSQNWAGFGLLLFNTDRSQVKMLAGITYMLASP